MYTISLWTPPWTSDIQRHRQWRLKVRLDERRPDKPVTQPSDSIFVGKQNITKQIVPVG